MQPRDDDGTGNLFLDTRAVSEVLGVVFMVGITVIIAAVVGVFALGLSQQAAQSEPPVAIGLETVDASTDRFVLEQDGGEGPTFNEITFKVQANGDSFTLPASTGSGQTFEPGDQITINTSNATLSLEGVSQYGSHEGSGFDLQSGDTLTVVVIDADSGTILAERTVLV